MTAPESSGADVRSRSAAVGETTAVIDVHADHVPPAVVAEARSHGDDYGVRVEHDEHGRERLRFLDGPTIRPFFHELCDVDDRIRKMDAQGVDTQVISTWTDIAGYHLPAREGARWARLQNNALAEAAKGRPDRLVAMGTLPMQDVAQACREMRYAIDELGVRAFEVCTSVNGRDLDGEEFRPLWSLACDLEVLVFLHPPVQQIGSERLGDYFLNNLVGNPTETTVAAARLMLSGVPKAFPHVKCLLAHGGGFLPYQLGRLDHGHRFVPATRSVVPELPSSFASWFFYDTILFDDRALAYLLDVVGPSRVVLGSDYPFEMCDEEAVARVQRTNLDAAMQASVLGATTQRLLTGPAVTSGPAPEGPDREPPAIGIPVNPKLASTHEASGHPAAGSGTEEVAALPSTRRMALRGGGNTQADFVMANDDTMAKLAVSQINDAGKESKVDVTGGGGTTPAALKDVQEGNGPFVADPGASARWIGLETMDLAARAMSGKAPASTTTYVPQPYLAQPYLDKQTLAGVDTSNQNSVYGDPYVQGLEKVWRLAK